MGVYALCEFYKIDQGAIEVGCDGITALERGFDEAKNPSISAVSAQHFDMILTIRNIRARCPIRWKHRHVKGHQDDNRSTFLDRWALLNIDMDLAAKVHWHLHAEHRHRPVWKIHEEPWSLWIVPRKPCRNLRDQITDFIQGTKAKEHWDSRNRFGQATSADVDWEACGQAMASASLTTRHWIVKHTSGICGTETLEVTVELEIPVYFCLSCPESLWNISWPSTQLVSI
jgi:hypothetical protein